MVISSWCSCAKMRHQPDLPTTQSSALPAAYHLFRGWPASCSGTIAYPWQSLQGSAACCSRLVCRAVFRPRTLCTVPAALLVGCMTFTLQCTHTWMQLLCATHCLPNQVWPHNQCHLSLPSCRSSEASWSPPSMSSWWSTTFLFWTTSPTSSAASTASPVPMGSLPCPSACGKASTSSCQVRGNPWDPHAQPASRQLLPMHRICAGPLRPLSQPCHSLQALSHCIPTA